MNTGTVTDDGWSWTPELYAGSAAFYVRGRVPYPPELADALAAELGLDGAGRLLDIGCGPGSLTLLLAGLFEQTIGLDADAEMLGEAARQAAASGVTSVNWVCMRAEQLPAGLGSFRVITLAQSFHWMDRATVARAAHGMLVDGGVLVHVGATTHHGVDIDTPQAHPTPPWPQIDRLVESYLHEQWDAGRGVPRRRTGGDEPGVFRAAGFEGHVVRTVTGRLVNRDVDDIVASVLSLSRSTPALFGPRLPSFVDDLRRVLRSASATGLFAEQMPDITLSIWRR